MARHSPKQSKAKQRAETMTRRVTIVPTGKRKRKEEARETLRGSPPDSP